MHNRSEWQSSSQPITGPDPTGQEREWVIHYPGSSSTQPQSDSEMPQYLRNMQNYYVTSRGYSLGYNWVVCNATGSVWQVRGYDYRNAANSGGKVSGNHNSVSISIMVTCSNSDAVSAAAVDSVNGLIAERSSFTVVPHSAVEWTECCGASLSGAIASGQIGQGASPVDPDVPPVPVECVKAAPGDGGWSLMRKLGMDPTDVVQRAAFYDANYVVYPDVTVCRP